MSKPRPDPYLVVPVSAVPDFTDVMPVMVDAATRSVLAAACAVVRSRPGFERCDENECLREALSCYVAELTNNDPETGTD